MWIKVFRVVHIDRQRRRRRLKVRAPSNTMAMEWVEQLYGDAFYVTAINLGPDLKK